MRLLNEVLLLEMEGYPIYDKKVSDRSWDSTSRVCSLDTNWARCQRCILAKDCNYKHEPHVVQPMPRK